MDMEKLNAIARGAFLPTIKVTDLEKDQLYMVTKLRQVTTKYGPKVVAELDEAVQVFLPKRLCEAFQNDEEFFTQMQAKANKMQLFIKNIGGCSLKFETQ